MDYFFKIKESGYHIEHVDAVVDEWEDLTDLSFYEDLDELSRLFVDYLNDLGKERNRSTNRPKYPKPSPKLIQLIYDELRNYANQSHTVPDKRQIELPFGK